MKPFKCKNKYLMRSVDELKDDMKQLAPRIKYLVQIIKDIINDFAKKRSRNVLDFADYEHFALQILTDENGRLLLSLKSIVINLKKYLLMNIKIPIRYKRQLYLLSNVVMN